MDRPFLVPLRPLPRVHSVVRRNAEPSAPPSAPRRAAAAVGVAAAAAFVAEGALRRSARFAPSGPALWPPRLERQTLRRQLGPEIWGLEQVIAFFTVSANIRMTVVKLEDGKLWVNGPIAATDECLELLDELGEVAHLVVPGTAVEHQSALGDFARRYPKASVWVAPGVSAPCRVDGVLGTSEPPWRKQIDFQVFYVAPPETAGTYAETAFFHKKSQTLLLTDAVLQVPEQPPEILKSYGYEGAAGSVSQEQWYYKFLAFNFLEMRGTDKEDFQALARAKGVVSPILRFTLYPICQRQALEWVQRVAKWPFKTAVAGHLASPFPLTPKDFSSAFGFLSGQRSSWDPVDASQLRSLRKAAETLDGPQALQSDIWEPYR
ncbi:unnamed protein product [Effrenium voratum]|uniref:Uncharacterized protein n=1 Tax=Effrenium voratum TaxID=2562239 RepID=A0AA36ITK6_9DINO|nr:unnamed protein product [Effrenium voratum]CAJ1446805.1 unnamed protein product [Effrenium voratum]